MSTSYSPVVQGLQRPLLADGGLQLCGDVQPLDWHAVYTRSNLEKRAAAELISKGIEVYLPVFREVHRWKDRNKTVELPLFPGYVFVRTDETAQTQLRVLRTAGVVRFVGSSGTPERIPDAQIAAVQRLLMAGLPYSAHPFLREGARVIVKRGVLKGTRGFLLRNKNEARLILSIDLLSRAVATEIDIADVEVIQPAP